MKKTLAILYILLISSVFFASGVNAQDVKTIIEPSFRHIVMKPGSTHLFTLDLTNTGDPQLYNFKLYQLGNPDLRGNLLPQRTFMAPLDITITSPSVRFDEQFLLRTDEKQKVPVKVTIPENTPNGEYYFALSAETISPIPNQGTASIQLSAGNATLLIVSVTKDNVDKKNIETSLFKAITGFTIPLGKSNFHIVNTKKQIPISLIVRNAGTFSVVPKGEIVIKDQNGQVQRFEVAPVYIYPGSQRLLTTADFSRDYCLTEFNKEICSKDYSLVIKNLPSGLYEATAMVSYGNPDPIIYNRDFFIVLPLPIIVSIVILITILVSLLAYAWYRHLNTHKIRSKHHK